ncbi:MAG: ABC transporter permease [Erysipelotrichaceae bacterium]|jgi:oligopeptide transport system permease protein|nr:ABC transporter permease [Erysipelotrichaceae bacterium]
MEEAKRINDLIVANEAELFTVIGTSEEEIERIDSAPYSFWRASFRQLFKKPFVIVCFIMLFLVVFFTIFGPMMLSYEIYDSSTTTAERFGDPQIGYYQFPTADHWFGICGKNMGASFEGLDLWTCVWEGARLSLLLAIVVSLINVIVGLTIGALWGYFKWLDPIMLEIRNFISNVPTLLLYILLMNVFIDYMEDYGFFIIVFLLTMFSWMGLATIMRNQIIIIRNREYNIASKTLGTSSSNMILHNLLPYLVSIIVTVVSGEIPGVISAEVSLAFFGLSFDIKNGDVTLGQVLTASTQGATGTASGAWAPWLTNWYLLLAPLVVLVPLTISFYYIGFALADATDPRTHR